MNTSAYIKARMRLPENKLKFISQELGKKIDNNSSSWKFKNRDVYLGDGAVISLEDTKEIKKEFPSTKRLGRQQGPPKMRFLGFFSASSGAYIDGEIGSYCGKGQAETSLFRKMHSRFKKGSILIFDKFFTKYELRKDIVGKGNDYVIRSRDLKAKKVLGRKKDLTITEKKGKKDSGMSVRYVKSTTKRKGFRPTIIYIVTSLLEEDGYTREDVETLYLKRWSVELDIRNLKQTLDATKLKSKTPSGVKKELWVTLIAYNMIRKMGNINSQLNNNPPRKQAFKIYIECLLQVLTGAARGYEASLYSLTKNEIMNSPYRWEPRLKRYRGQKYKELKISRKEAKKLHRSSKFKQRPSGPLQD